MDLFLVIYIFLWALVVSTLPLMIGSVLILAQNIIVNQYENGTTYKITDPSVCQFL